MERPDRSTCEDTLRRLEDFLDRELTLEAMRQVEAHLDTCAACAGQFEFERGVLDGLREKIRRVSLPAELRARIARSIDSQRRASGK